MNEKALLIELSERGLNAECQVPVIVKYKDKTVGEYFADIVVENKIILEIKASERRLLMSNPDSFVNKNTMLVREFDRYILEHPEFAEKIFDNALVVMQIADDEEFNEWARRTAQGMAEKDTPIVYVTITELKPVRSRIEKLKVEMAA